MRLWHFHRLKVRQPLRIALSQFLHKMTPFELKLATRHIKLARSPRVTDLPAIKPITAGYRLTVHDTQILSDKAQG